MHKGSSVKITRPIKRSFIVAVAAKLRELYLLEGEKFFPIVQFIECVLPSCDPGFTLDIVEDEELPYAYAETTPTENLIRIRESVYCKACEHDSFSRQVLAHELWHYMAHDDANVSYAYADEHTHIPISMDPEKQANAFAAELLAPAGEVKGLSIATIREQYGVTRKTAYVQSCGIRDTAYRAQKQKNKGRKRKNGQAN